MTKQRKQSNQILQDAAGEAVRSKSKKPVKGGESKPRTRCAHGRALVTRLLKKIETKLANGESGASMSDFIRLVQLDREMAEDEPAREIRVTWVDGEKGSDSAG